MQTIGLDIEKIVWRYIHKSLLIDVHSELRYNLLSVANILNGHNKIEHYYDKIKRCRCGIWKYEYRFGTTFCINCITRKSRTFYSSNTSHKVE